MEVRRVIQIFVLCSLYFEGKVSGTSPDSVIESAIPQDGGGHTSRGSVGLTVGLVLAVIVIIVVSCAILWYCRRRRRRRRPEPVYLEEIIVHRPDIPKALAKEDELQGIEKNCPIEKETLKNIPLEAVVSIMEPKKRDFHHGLRRTEEAATISTKIKVKAKKFTNIRSWFKTKKSRDKERKKKRREMQKGQLVVREKEKEKAKEHGEENAFNI
ncbi:uncharacterized protein [Dendropsophus ebraccatus]|uniref:uncharacterized protein n=1 Tax=Dendropsophus ebraccatus TaxID=150705 RepID=UPI0038322803